MRYYIGPWQWKTGPVSDPGQESSDYWGPPDGAIASLDLRPLPFLGPGPVAQGFGLFAFPDPFTPDPAYSLIANDLDQIPPVPRRQLWRTSLGLGAFGAIPFRDMLGATLTTLSDPSGETVVAPIRPKLGRARLHIKMAQLGVVYRTNIRNQSHPAWAKILDVEVREYKKLRARARSGNTTDPDIHRRFNRLQLRRYPFVTDYRVFVGGEDDGPPLEPSTIYTESFNQADSSTIGPDLTWTEYADTTTVSNQWRGAASNWYYAIRAQHDLSGGDMYTKASLKSVQGRMMSAVRFNHSANTAYIGGPTEGENEIQIGKMSGATFTELATQSRTISDTTFYETTLTVDGTDLDLVVGAWSLSTTDSSYGSSITRGGLSTRTSQGKESFADWFETGDITAAGAVNPALLKNNKHYLRR